VISVVLNSNWSSGEGSLKKQTLDPEPVEGDGRGA